MDYSIIKKAGLTRREVADIIGVSYVTIWKYMKTNTEPRESFMGIPLRLRVVTLLAILDKLVAAEKLPKTAIAFSKRMPLEVKEKRAALCDKLRDLLNTKIAEQSTNT